MKYIIQTNKNLEGFEGEYKNIKKWIYKKGKMELPDKLIKKVLLYLDHETLKKQLVIKIFRRVILESPELMEKLPLVLSGRNWRTKLEFLGNLGQFITKIEVTRSVVVRSDEEIFDFLVMLPNLEILMLSPEVHYKYNENLKEKIEKPTLKNLRILEISGAVKLIQAIIKYIWGNEELEKVTLINNNQYGDPVCTEFIMKQKKLKYLRFSGNPSLIFHESIDISRFQNVEFQLEALIFERVELKKSERVAEFLKTQSNLKELKLNEDKVDFQYFVITFENFKNLRTFQCFTYALSTSSLEQEKFKMESVENLHLVGNLDYDLFHNFINIFPNVRKLHCDDLSAFHFGFSEITQKIEMLSINYLTLNSLLFVHFPRIKLLNVNLMNIHSSEQSVRIFFSRNPTIEEMYIRQLESMETAQTAIFNLRIILRNLHFLKKLSYLYLNCEIFSPRNPLGNADNPEIENLNVFTIEVNKLVHPKQLQINRFFRENFQEEFNLLQNLFGDCHLRMSDTFWAVPNFFEL